MATAHHVYRVEYTIALEKAAIHQEEARDVFTRPQENPRWRLYGH